VVTHEDAQPQRNLRAIAATVNARDHLIEDASQTGPSCSAGRIAARRPRHARLNHPQSAPRETALSFASLRPAIASPTCRDVVTQNSTDNASAPGEQLITCSVIHEGPLAKILVSGEIDIASLHRLVAAANDALGAPGIQQLVIDLSEVSFADTVALLWLVRTVRDGRRRHLDPIVHVRDGPVLAVLRVTGLIEQLPVVFEASTTRAPAEDPPGEA
jgi:anti-anti-sigma factor